MSRELKNLLAEEDRSGSRAPRPSSSRGPSITAGILALASPTKKRVGSLNMQDPMRPVSDRRHFLSNGQVQALPVKKKAENGYVPPPVRSSSFASKMIDHHSSSAAAARVAANRTTSFDKPAPPPSRKGKGRETLEQADDRMRSQLNAGGNDEAQRVGPLVKLERDEDSLRLVEKLEMGPKEFGTGPEGDGRWESVEPNSQIRLLKRLVPHYMVQEHLSDRYYIPPSLLYSVINPSRDGTSFDVPVDGDWVTIAVVAAQNGPIRTTKGGPSMGKDEDSSGDEGTNSNGDPNGRKIKVKKVYKPAPLRKFVSYKLVALPPRSSSKSAAAGDATLNMLMFESDSSVPNKNGVGRIFKGGSRGAFEKFWNIKIGTVVAILNPGVLKPLKNAQSPHPLTNALALRPNSAESIIPIGFARDMGRCTALKADGNRCSDWVDTRNGETCDFHIHALHKKLRSGRAEFASSTSSFEVGVKPHGTRTGGAHNGRRKDTAGEYNPALKTGLLPRDTREARQPTYVDGNRIVRDAAASVGFEFVGEKLGRTKMEKMKRKRDEKEADAKILDLLDKDGGSTQGGKYLELARRQQRAEEREKENERNAEKKKLSGKGKKRKDVVSSEEEINREEEEGRKRKKSAFKPEHIKAIGFDPTMLATGAIRAEETPEEKKLRLQSISLLIRNDTADDDSLNLGPIAGRRPKSGWSSVRVPNDQRVKPEPDARRQAAPAEKFIDLDSDDGEDQ